ncbi:MAG: ribonuclease E/G [Pseudomonadota bacterium]
MSSKMLIDASHPEETRVVVTNDKRLADYDFESEHKSQLRGNIYLAKVTRVEPSLQAAFVDFGGNRHGFLAFSEIHPDYYQIPLADRQALLEEEEAFANAEADEEEEQAEKERKGRRRRRRRGRGRRSQNADVPDAEPVAMEALLAAYEAGDGFDNELSDNQTMAADVDDDGDMAITEELSDTDPIDGEDGQSEDDDSNGDDFDEVGESDDALEVSQPRRRAPRRRYKIQEIIKRRQVILVQVVKEERGNKGAALTTYLSLAGRYSVLMPNTARGGGISRKISNVSDRKRLKDVVKKLDVPKGMGVILRTAGEDQSEEEIVRDYEYLMRLWDSVRDLTLASTAPALVYAEGSLIKRSLRDLYNPGIREVLVSGDSAYEEAKEFMGMIMPEAKGIVKRWRDAAPILAKTGMEDELDRLVQPQVTLKSGGYLIINQTEALVAIDVNSGKSTKEHSIEETALATNLEAAEEVARQLRLRDLAGLIVIDFIDMDENRNNRAVEKKLKESLKTDRARIQVGRISHFGLLEMSRQRMRASVLESTMTVCPHCNGTGYVRSPQAVALHLLRSLEEQLTRNSKFDLSVKTPVDTALYLLNKKRETLTEMEERFGVNVNIEADNSIGAEMFTVDRAGSASRTPRASTAIGMGYDVEGDVEDVDVEDVDTRPSFDTNDNEQDEDDGRSRKRRRRRRGGKGRDRPDGTEVGETEAAAPDSEAAGDDEEEGRNGRKRRRRSRGKRGGRNRRDDRQHMPAAEPVGPLADLIAAQAQETEQDAQSDTGVEPEIVIEAEAPVQETPISEANLDEMQPENLVRETDEAPKDTEAEGIEVASRTDSGDTETSAKSNGDDGEKQTRPRATEANLNLDVKPVVVSSANGDGSEEEKPKKRAGWWSRRNFF